MKIIKQSSSAHAGQILQVKRSSFGVLKIKKILQVSTTFLEEGEIKKS
jgi:hypothetical protein